MSELHAIRARVEELAVRDWDLDEITARWEELMVKGIIRKDLNKYDLLAEKANIQNRVQLRAEEYNLLAHNCAQGTALALFEEFGLGSLQVAQALAPFPGIAGTGEMCGGVTGSLIAIGLLFASSDVRDVEQNEKTMGIGQKFIAYFEYELGYLYCQDIIENIILGERVNPGDGPEFMEIFAQRKGFEKCGLPPGIGARLAAGFMIDHLS